VDQVIISSGGNVGIGTTAPLSSLHINTATSTLCVGPYCSNLAGRIIAGGSDAEFTFLDRGATSFVNTPTAGERWVLYSTGGIARLWSGGDKVAITPSGNVGIGTTAPTSKLYVAGDFTATGVKNFEVNYPGDPNKKIVYSTLEGPEAGTYIRGTAVCENQETQIVFPDHFRLVTAQNGLTGSLTPRGSFSSLYIKELTTERLVVGCEDGKSFDYVVFGIRKGYENFEVVRSK
jgi:hypothetical protein